MLLTVTDMTVRHIRPVLERLQSPPGGARGAPHDCAVVHHRWVAKYRVTVTYTVNVVDGDALRAAGRAVWPMSPDWEIPLDGYGKGGVGADIADEVDPNPEASIAWVVGQQDYPVVPGVRFGSASVNVVPGIDDDDDR
jgi:hypothetical protein